MLENDICAQAVELPAALLTFIEWNELADRLARAAAVEDEPVIQGVPGGM